MPQIIRTLTKEQQKAYARFKLQPVRGGDQGSGGRMTGLTNTAVHYYRPEQPWRFDNPQWYYYGPCYPAIPPQQPYCCPICKGQGKVSVPFGVPADREYWDSTNAGPFDCEPCGGTGVLWR